MCKGRKGRKMTELLEVVDHFCIMTGNGPHWDLQKKGINI